MKRPQKRPKTRKKRPTAKEVRKKELEKARRSRKEDESDEEYERRFMMCARKRHYPSRGAVMAAASRSKNGIRWRWYKCPYCHGWHLTGH